MKLFNFPIILAALSFVVACGPATLPETIEAESQALPSPTAQPSTLPTEIIMDSGSSPVATPTREQVEVAQSSPVATPSPTRFSNEETKRETDKANVPDEAVIIFQRSGGFAGVNETFFIDVNGRIVGNDGQEQQVTSEQIASILQQADTAGFFELQESYLPRDTCCDRFIYQITMQNDHQSLTVVTIDGAKNQPEALTTTLDTIIGLLSSVGF